VLFFYFVPDTTRDNDTYVITIFITDNQLF
jgi:hypothetical protein